MKTLDPWKERGLKMAEDLPRRVNGYLVTQPKRWTKAANGRVLPLNSAAWQRLRRSVLAEQPLCQYCPPGVITPANTVDHANNNPADNSRENLISCCVPCHSRKTASDMHGRPPPSGCDEQGYPIGSDHPWNQAAMARSGAAAGHDGDEQNSPETNAPEPTSSLRFNACCLKKRHP